MKSKVKIYCNTGLILTLILTLFRCVSLAAFYDVDLGYFNGGFVPTMMNAIYFIASAWCLSPIVLLPKSQIRAEFTPSTAHFKGASVFAAVLFLLSSTAFFGTRKLAVFTVALVIISALFFISTLFNKESLKTARAFLSIAVILTLIISLAKLYFDMTIAMNSPHKLLGSFSFMAAMVFMLCEVRVYLGKQLPRLHLAASLLTFLLGISFSFSALSFLFAAAPRPFVTNPIVIGNFGYIGIIAGISVYALSRSFSFESVFANEVLTATDEEKVKE